MSLNDIIVKLQYFMSIAGNVEITLTELNSLGDGTGCNIIDVVLRLDCDQPQLVFVFE
jgi:hypothetical protein